MGKIFCAEPASNATAAPIVADAPVIAAPFNLYDSTPTNEGNDEKPRDATSAEAQYYLDWLARKRGVGVPAHAVYRECGICIGNDVIVAMPGYGVSANVTCELLDDAGEVVRTMTLPPVSKGRGAGGLPMTAAQVKDWTGLEAVAKPRKPAKPRAVKVKPAAAPEIVAPVAVEPAPAPVQPVPVISAPSADVQALAATVERLAARLAILERGTRSNARPVRTEAERRAIIRAWRMRAEMRSRADLDRRALEAANGAYRGLLDQYETARADRVVALDRVDYLTTHRDRLFAESNRMMDGRQRTARRLSTARAAARTARREAIGMETAWRMADAELQRLAPVAAAIAAIAAAAPPAPAGLRLVSAA